MALPQYRDEVLVTLSSLDTPASFSFPRRQFLLTKEKTIMDIGRTSKRNSSLEAAKNNAWFDSAVMSRDHAQLILDVEKEKVYIKDIGALHGTYHNDLRISRYAPLTLNNGDTLRFGIPIERGADKYPPCTMEVHMEFGTASPQDRPKVFRVPDDTDVEDSCSDADDSIRNSTKIARRIIIPTWTSRYGRQAESPSIDLTTSDQYPLSNVRDNRDQTATIMPTDSPIVNSSNKPTCVDLTSPSDDEECGSSLGAHWLLGLGGDADEARSGISHDTHDMSTHATFGDESQCSSLSSSPSPELTSCPPAYQNFISDEDEDEDEDDDDSDNQDMAYFDESDNGEEDLEEEDFEEQDEFEDKGMDDAVVAATAAAAEAAAMAAAESATEAFPTNFGQDIPGDYSAVSHTDLLSDVLHEPHTSSTQGYQPQDESESCSQPCLPVLSDGASNKLPPIEGRCPRSIYRLPSIIEVTSHSAKPLPPTMQPKITAQLLGRKTGKHEYFAAREQNKVLSRAVDSQSEAIATPAKEQNLQILRKTTTDSAEQGSGTSVFSSPELKMKTIQYHADNINTDASPSTFTAVNKPKFYECPPDSSFPRPPSLSPNRPSAFDAASAYEFERMCLEAKKVLDAQCKATESRTTKMCSEIQKHQDAHSKTTEPQIVPPSIIGPHAVVNKKPENTKNNALQDAKSAPKVSQEIPSQKPLKRKVADISELTPEEIAMELEMIKPSSADEHQRRPRVLLRPRQADNFSRSSTLNSVKMTESEASLSRPSKRIRRVAEVFGYAALGGMAVMSALIATAPTL